MAATVSGYTLVLPPGWERVPVRSGTSRAIKRILDRKLPVKISRDTIAPHRIKVEEYLKKMAAEARKQGGIDLYLPVEFREGTPIAASFIISQGMLAGCEQLTSEMLLAAFAGMTGDSTAATVDGAAALRTEHVVHPDAARGTEYGSRRVDYIIPVPRLRGRWLLAAFSTVVDQRTPEWFAKLLIELFDAIISTFRWTTAGNGSTMNEGAAHDRTSEPGGADQHERLDKDRL